MSLLEEAARFIEEACDNVDRFRDQLGDSADDMDHLKEYLCATVDGTTDQGLLDVIESIANSLMCTREAGDRLSDLSKVGRGYAERLVGAGATPRTVGHTTVPPANRPVIDSARDEVAAARISAPAVSPTPTEDWFQEEVRKCDPGLLDEARQIDAKLFDAVLPIVEPFYDENQEFAKENPHLRFYTSHGPDHICQVAAKSRQVAGALSEALKNEAPDDETPGSKRLGAYHDDRRDGSTVPPSIDARTLYVAALFHDTGMGEGGCRFREDENGRTVVVPLVANDKDFKDSPAAYGVAIRKNHPLNSALIVLRNRADLEKLGIDVDRVALECFAHSKSTSGIKNLLDKDQWDAAFGKMRDAVDAWNNNLPDSPQKTGSEIKFSSDNIKSALGSIALETLALRMGDANRETAPDGPLQSGEGVQITANDKPEAPANYRDDYDKEAAGYVIREKGKEGAECIGDSKSFILGETNIPSCRKWYDHGKIIDEITVGNGDRTPECTMKIIEDRIGEMRTACRNDGFEVRVKFYEGCKDSDIQEKYAKWRVEEASNVIDDDHVSAIKKFNGWRDETDSYVALIDMCIVDITFPWDEETA